MRSKMVANKFDTVLTDSCDFSFATSNGRVKSQYIVDRLFLTDIQGEAVYELGVIILS